MRARRARDKPPPPEVLQLMKEWHEQGDVFRKIASRLNGLHIRTPQGFRWYASTVRAALLRAMVDVRKNATVHALFDDVVLVCNDAITVACGGAGLTSEHDDPDDCK
jgi:hypothetical protein